MPQPVIDLTMVEVLQAIRVNYLQPMLPVSGVEVIRGQQNRTPPPKGTDWLVLTPLLRKRLRTNIETFTFGSTPTTFNIALGAQLTVQCDVFGPSSDETSTIIEATWRSSYGVAALAASGFALAPLYVDRSDQMPFEDSSQQIQERWSLDLVLQANHNITVSQDFAASLVINLINVDAKYPP